MEIMNSFIVTGCCSVLNVFGCLLETCDRKYNFAERGSQQHLVDSGRKTLEASQTPLWGYK